MRVLPKGTEITCPKCGILLVVSTEDIKPKTKLLPSMFSARRIQPIMGQKMRCPEDGEPFFLRGKIHTKDGWK